MRVHGEDACLDADDVAAFLHRRLGPASVHELDQHVALCADCRELLSALAGEPAPEQRHAPSRGELGGGGAAWIGGAAALAPGTLLGAYRLLEVLGEGGMGTVYLAEHTVLGRRAAIKVVLASLSDDAATVDRFFHEARAVSRIADPGIVQIFDFGYHADGSAFIVMELLAGEALDKRLARIDRFGLFECLRLVRMICTSLSAVHAEGIIHRDLKPANIFLVDDPAVVGGERPKLLDFGIAKLMRDDDDEVTTVAGTALGTPAYMSPEQCRGSGAIDQRADIYAIGCVMFAMLTGAPPFAGADTGELLEAHIDAPPPPASAMLPGLPGAIDQLLQRCLRKAPEERFASVAELARAIGDAERRLLRMQAPTAVRKPAAPRMPRSPRAPRVRKRPWLAVVVAAVAIAAGVAVVALRGRGDASRSAGAAAPALLQPVAQPSEPAVAAPPAAGSSEAAGSAAAPEPSAREPSEPTPSVPNEPRGGDRRHHERTPGRPGPAAGKLRVDRSD